MKKSKLLEELEGEAADFLSSQAREYHYDYTRRDVIELMADFYLKKASERGM